MLSPELAGGVMEHNGIGLAALCVVAAMYLAACSTVSGSPSTASTAPEAALNAPRLVPGSHNPSLPILPVDLLGQSRVITDYLKAHNLPLVGASMAADQPTQSGRQLTLYGYVATPQGKLDAEEQARRVINDPTVPIANRIVVRPELLAMGNSQPPEPPASTSDPSTAQNLSPDLQRYMTNDQIQAYQAHQQSKWTDWIVPAIMIGLMFVP
jgi:hypothetical protein